MNTGIFQAQQFASYFAQFVCLLHKVRTYEEYHRVCPMSELGLPPTPHPQASVPPPPCFWGEGNTRWRERGWESPNSDEGHTLWYSLYVRTLWLVVSLDSIMTHPPPHTPCVLTEPVFWQKSSAGSGQQTAKTWFGLEK
jgi:hypothetical protein